MHGPTPKFLLMAVVKSWLQSSKQHLRPILPYTDANVSFCGTSESDWLFNINTVRSCDTKHLESRYNSDTGGSK